jgi:arylsulfatase A-like enzyme
LIFADITQSQMQIKSTKQKFENKEKRRFYIHRKVNRREFLRNLSLSATVMVIPGCQGILQKDVYNSGGRPNVVLVMTDDQGYGDMACHGNRIIKTPNMDLLHGESIRLTNFHVEPTCAPTRAALMTGRYGARTGVWHTIQGRSLVRADEVTMADVFSEAGYSTGIFGKWHLGDNYPFRPQDRGFGEVFIHGGGGVGQTPDFWGNDYFDDTYLHNGKAKKVKGYCTDVWFKEAMKFIEENKDVPFFCYIPTNASHAPYNVADKYKRLYTGKTKDAIAAFYGMITNIDENIGKLEKKLSQLGIKDETIIIFMTDNGSAKGRAPRAFSAGQKGGKGSPYEGGHRVPFFIRWPNGKLGGGVDVSALTAHFDILPTLIDLCGLKKPAGVRFDGVSLKELLYRKADNSLPDRIIVVDHQRIEYPEKWRKTAVMTERWRLVNGAELYDIKADPGQEKDIADEYPEAVQKLRYFYEKWWDDVSVRFDEYCRIVIGSDKENPSRITLHDRHIEASSSQNFVKEGKYINGFWAIEVERDGKYSFELRRWPQEVDSPITGAVEGGKALDIKTARLKIADFDEIRKVRSEAKGIVFTASLKAGKTKMETWFTDDKGESLGANYVYVRRM